MGEHSKASLFHSLGIVLFELGHGKIYSEQLSLGNSKTNVDKAVLIKEIDKIPFGRAYRDVIKTCLTGNIYRTMGSSVDSQFNKIVLER